MTISNKIRNDQAIMGITKTNNLSHMIAHTDKGDLTLNIRKGEIAYTFCLDAVPYSDKDNKELIQLFDGILYTL